MNFKIKQFFVFLGDVIFLYLSLWLMIVFRFEREYRIFYFKQHLLPFSLIFLVWLIVFYIADFYDISNIRFRLVYFWRLIKVLGVNALLAMSIFYITLNLTESSFTPRRNIFVVLIIFAVLKTFWCFLFDLFLKSRGLGNNLAIIGMDKRVLELVDKIKENPGLGFNLKLIIGDENSKGHHAEFKNRYLNLRILENVPAAHELVELLIKEKIRIAVIVQNPHLNSQLVQKLFQCLPLKIDFIDFPNFYENLTGKIPVSIIGQVWFLENLRESQKRHYEIIKRGMDILFVLTLGPFFILLLPILIIGIKLNSTGPVFYRQERIGRNGKVFDLIKLRTMVKDAEKDKPQWQQKEDPRITLVGEILRKTHLDELPQLYNVLKGDMSFIGPRPERPEFVEELNKEIPFYQTRHLIKPGITGWAQMKYRYGASREDSLEKLQYDLFYIKNRSLPLDVGIFLRTINTVIKRFRKQY